MTTNTQQPITAYKGFNQSLQCRGMQYEIGQTYTHDGKVKACQSGFHACENPLNVFDYYPPSNSRFAVVEMSGEISCEEAGDSKIAAGKIAIKAELKLPELIDCGVQCILSKINFDNTPATNTGDWSAATNTGDWSAATNTGNRSAATNTGNWSAATNTGDWSAATNTGNWSAATNTGDWSAATNTGDWSAATNTGNQSAADVSGKHAVACALGQKSKAKAGTDGAIVCVYRDNDGGLMHIRASKVGENGIKPDVWYTLNEHGEFVECQNE